MAQERFLKSFDGTDLYTSTLGSGTCLVLCDGLGCDGFVWRHLKRAFEDRCRIVHWNYRGHGLSAQPADPQALTVHDLCGDMKAVLDGLGVEKAVLLGHSMGVQVILEFALQNPDRVLGLVPICGSYGRPLTSFHGNDRAHRIYPYLNELVQRFTYRVQPVWQRLLLSELAYQVATRLEVNGKLVRRVDFEPYFQHMASMRPDTFMTLLGNLNQHTVEDRLPELQTPTLIVAGEQDTFTPAWLSRRMQQLIAGSELLVMPGGTHTAPIEIPELLHLRLARFLDTHFVERQAATSPKRTRRRKRTVA